MEEGVRMLYGYIKRKPDREDGRERVARYRIVCTTTREKRSNYDRNRVGKR